jgi:hypothetical protein
MHVSMDPKLRMWLDCFELPYLKLGFYIYVVTTLVTFI